ncbi:hypothetical protein [Actinomadura flavalba]|uniref:hypothetical protein n=1 Tax=Actinomadura flavalba TaxID=1120938 RepID=UPI00039B0A66|nr:hypothetical protein [Actinomadura flavalba]
MRAFTPLALLGAAGALLLTAPAATADEASAKGPKGQTLTVSRTTGLDAAGTTLTVKGTGYDEGKGIYVAFCKDNGPGKTPSPCGGGADTSGKTGGSQWISSNPPPYGKGLAVPYEKGGAFSVTIKIAAKLNDEVDCATEKCVVATRSDHTRAGDHTQDVRVPVTFEGDGLPVVPLAIGGAAAVLVLGGGAVFLLRKRRATP